MPNDQPDYTAVVNSQTALFNGVSVAQDGATHDLGVVTVPSNTHSLEVIWSTTTQIVAISAIGQTSLLDWALIGLPRLGSLTSPRVVMPLRRAVDGQVDIKIGFQTGSGNAKVWVIAMTDSSMEVLDASQPGSQVIVDATSGRKAGVAAGGGISGNVQATLEFANPAIWEADGTLLQLFNGALNGGATVTLVAGVFAQSIRILELVAAFTATPPGSVQLQDSSGPSTLAILNLLGQFPPPLRPRCKLGNGGALQLVNTSATAIGMGVFGSTTQGA